MLSNQRKIEAPIQKTRNEYRSVLAKGPMLDRVYSMRYKSYSEKDFIEKSTSEKFMDEFDGTQNCHSFLTFHEGKAIGSIRGCLHDPSQNFSIPIVDVFFNEIRQSVGFDQKMLEINKFVIAPHFQRRGGLRARFAIYDNVVSMAQQNDARYLVAGVREEHIGYNQKMFGFELASDLLSYPHLNFKTALMVCEDINAVKEKIDSKLKPRKSFDDSSPRYGVC
ncbi:MAG: hypothetical protein K6L76_00855 [Agarilytica sp.]